MLKNFGVYKPTSELSRHARLKTIVNYESAEKGFLVNDTVVVDSLPL